MPTFNSFEMKQSFWKSVKYLWRYRIFEGTVYRLKVENFKSCRWAKLSPCHCKIKILGHLKFSAQMPTFKTFEMKQSFWKSVKYLWRYRIFAVTVYRLKVGNFKSCRWAKFSRWHCKSKIPAHMKFSAQMPTFKTFEMKQSFWKSGKYLWRYRIFAGTVYRLKVENFKSCRWAKFSPCHCKSKIPGHLKFSAQMSTFKTLEMKQRFWKSVKYLWRYSIFAGTVYRLKVENFKSCRWAKFSRCHCKSKIPGHLNVSAQIPTFNTFEMKQSFYRLKLENFKSCRRAKFSPCHCKSKIPGHLKFSARIPTFKAFEMKQCFWKSGKYLWRYRIFAGTVYRLKVGNFKSCRWAKFSPCHCKSKIPAHMNFSGQMPTFNTFEMKQSFWKSVKYLWRYRIFARYSLQVESGKFQILSMG